MESASKLRLHLPAVLKQLRLLEVIHALRWERCCELNGVQPEEDTAEFGD